MGTLSYFCGTFCRLYTPTVHRRVYDWAVLVRDSDTVY
jgi:hypothetical protein